MERGRPEKIRQLADLSVEEAASKMKVSKRSAERAKAVLKQDPALADEVAQGETKLADATKAVADKAQEAPDPPPPSRAGSRRAEGSASSLKKAVAALIEKYGFDAVSDAVLEHNP